MLSYWTSEFTTVVIRGVSRSRTPRQRLLETMKMIDDHELTKYELPIRSWAAIDANAAKAVRQVKALRTKFVGSIFENLGFRGSDLEMGTRMFVVYYSLSSFMFPAGSKSKREQLIKKQLDWFCKK